HTDRGLANAGKDAEFIRKAEESRLSAASQGSTAARVDAANAGLDEKVSQSLAAADTAAGTSRVLAADAKEAELLEKTEEDSLGAETTNILNTSASGQAALGAQKDAELQKTTADNDSKS